MQDAIDLLTELVDQATLGAFAKEVLAENVATIASVFAAIHAKRIPHP